MTVTSDKTLFQSVIKMMDSLSASGNYDTIVHILSLLCLFSVLNQTPMQNTLPAANEGPAPDNPLQKLLGSLMKTDGNNASAGGNPLSSALGAALGSPDLLSSLLPLLSNPQIKSKINPANIASVMGMINNLGGLGGLANLGGALTPSPAQTNNEKNEAKVKAEKKTLEPETSFSDSSDQQSQLPEQSTAEKPLEEKHPPAAGEKRSANRFLNWKTNF